MVEKAAKLLALLTSSSEFEARSAWHWQQEYREWLEEVKAEEETEDI